MADSNKNAPSQRDEVHDGAPEGRQRATKQVDATNIAAASAARKPSFKAECAPLVAAGLTLIPLDGKKPLHNKWVERSYDTASVIAAAEEARQNVGVRLQDSGLLVIDVDPRNGGDASFERLKADFDIDLDAYPVVRTGSGGLHVYTRRPDGFAVAGKLDGYPGIDFKSSGQVVAPGSLHPDTGLPYVAERMDLLALEALAPIGLIEALSKSRSVSSNRAGMRVGEWTPRMLAKNLEQLDPDDYVGYEQWLEMLMASHHATGGDGLEEFIEWSTQFTGDRIASAEVITEKWNGLRANDKGITLQYICRQLHDRGLPVHDRSEPEDDFDAIDDGAAVAGEKRWRFLSVDDLEALPPPQWLVPGLLTEGSIAAIYGAPESGKSFLAVDMSMSVASGIAWHGREVLAGAVLYVAAEGAPGLGKRVRAWVLDKGATSQPIAFSLMRDPLNLTTEKEARDFAAAARAGLGELRMIVIDTLNQTAAGADENSAKEMGQYIAGMKRLRDATGATVVVVHHSGKDETKGMRGSTALLGAMDTTVEVARSTDGRSIEVRVRKQKDAERDPPMRFNLEKVAGSLVLRSTVMADAASDFGGNAIRVMARELANDGRVALKDLVATLKERDGVSDKTARRRIADAIPEGGDVANRTVDGWAIWSERADGNPRGEVIVMVVEVPGCHDP
ncbi:MAG: AAA family ATPase [Brevibacterium aurantiacum]|nr:AAA family ATPase [Brevibacterium aurantiacum]